MPADPIFARALEDGARRSREACLAVPPRQVLTPELLWQRFKWPLIGLGMFLLIEMISMGKLITVMGTHF
jgi:hypothetical protein